ncbi:NADP-reducing hydrogenase subunit HndC [Planctomycetes bacterium Pan216]|uniref:NADP-reducing hydrogenase subunit HndC n=1 Tax=Kolteria novifilia TaxID=2527975 RepID=A0A518AYG2_9BACT|nr:NADP-reducing hydrogenase subunit HndC [Planctomycetes bacterium Pan216]
MTPDELSQLSVEERERQQGFEHCLNVCTAASCLSSGAEEVKKGLTTAVKEKGLREKCRIRGAGCMGLCSSGPLVALDPEDVLYQHVGVDDVPEIVESLDTQPVPRLLCDTTIPFFQRQKKIVLENSGRIDPERIEDYIAVGGYRSLARVLTEMDPDEVVQEIVNSGLRGRGGAGYPTGLKWGTVAKATGAEKYVICNADEGDPGAFMDRAVLESDPHRVLEGMTIAAYAVGATQGYIYVRAEYPLAIKRLRQAIKQAQRLGLQGDRIYETPFRFTVDIRLGAGAFVCGEETALIASIEGGRGLPRPRPPYPANHGLWGCPTLINNVETFANVAAILREGAGWFSSIGTEKSKGTKVFSLAGPLSRYGLIEVPMGISLREIVFDIAGGLPDGKSFKAVQTGGPSGGCIPARHLDTSVDYESLRELGAIMGSGGMIVMDESSNMVDVARFFMEFCMTESCGKCVPCRVGTYQMHTLLDRIYNRQGTKRDLELLSELCEVVRETSLCGLGQTAPNPVNSTLRYFRDEYEERLVSDGVRGPSGDPLAQVEMTP